MSGGRRGHPRRRHRVPRPRCGLRADLRLEPAGLGGPTIRDEQAEAFREVWRASGLGPLAAHAPYLGNIASPNPAFLERSRQLASATALTCDRMGVDLLVLHSGAGGTEGDREDARDRAGATLRRTVGDAEDVRILVELMAGTAGAVASSIPEAAALLEATATTGSGCAWTRAISSRPATAWTRPEG